MRQSCLFKRRNRIGRSKKGGQRYATFDVWLLPGRQVIECRCFGPLVTDLFYGGILDRGTPLEIETANVSAKIVNVSRFWVPGACTSLDNIEKKYGSLAAYQRGVAERKRRREHEVCCILAALGVPTAATHPAWVGPSPYVEGAEAWMYLRVPPSHWGYKIRT